MENGKSKNPLMTKTIRRLTISSVLMTIIGGFLYFKFDDLLSGALKSQLQISEDSDFAKMWSKNPFPIKIDVYVFGIENPEQFADGEKAVLKQYGPYTYE